MIVSIYHGAAAPLKHLYKCRGMGTACAYRLQSGG